MKQQTQDEYINNIDEFDITIGACITINYTNPFLISVHRIIVTNPIKHNCQVLSFSDNIFDIEGFLEIIEFMGFRKLVARYDYGNIIYYAHKSLISY